MSKEKVAKIKTTDLPKEGKSSQEPDKGPRANIVLKVLMWIFFPIGLFVKWFVYFTRRHKVKLTTKTSLLYSVMFVVLFSAYIAFVFIVVEDSVISGDFTSLHLKLIVGTIIVFSIATAAFITFGALAGQTMLYPLRKIIKKLDKITANDMSQRLDKVDSQDELMELTDRLNEMLDDLESSFMRQKNFVSDASHELRTPIAVIQGYADLLDRWGKTDQAVLEEAISAMKTESLNMKYIVVQLLYLARLGSFKPNISEFDLSEAISDVVSGYIMTNKEKEINVKLESGISILSDRAMVVEIIRIIVDNAIKYTKEDGKINISTLAKHDVVWITIADNGMGISAEDLPHIFDRFYRCDKARGRETGSTGLGLSIARSIADILSAEISVSSKLKKGTTFVIKMKKKTPFVEHGATH